MAVGHQDLTRRRFRHLVIPLFPHVTVPSDAYDLFAEDPTELDRVRLQIAAVDDEDELADREIVITKAIKAFMALAVPSDMGSTSGGGGGVQGELSRWDGLPAERKDEYIDWARRAARDASTACEPKKKKKAYTNRR